MSKPLSNLPKSIPNASIKKPTIPEVQWVENPETGNYIKVGGPIYNKLYSAHKSSLDKAPRKQGNLFVDNEQPHESESGPFCDADSCPRSYPVRTPPRSRQRTQMPIRQQEEGAGPVYSGSSRPEISTRRPPSGIRGTGSVKNEEMPIESVSRSRSRSRSRSSSRSRTTSRSRSSSGSRSRSESHSPKKSTKKTPTKIKMTQLAVPSKKATPSRKKLSARSKSVKELDALLG